MLGARQIANQKPPLYATGADFCRIFEKDMNGLYLLSFLLTADGAMAETCYVCGLEDSKKGNRVFKEWAESWARRTIIQNAIRMIRPRATDRNASTSELSRSAGHATTQPAEISQVAALPAFERFAYVKSELERYSDQDCSLLLDCNRGEVIAARNRALERITRSTELDRRGVSIDSEEQSLRGEPGSGMRPEAFARLAASA